MRVVTCSFLPMAEAIRLYRLGAHLEQNLFGAVALERAGHDVIFLQQRMPRVQRLSALTRQRLGDLDQQWQSMRAKPDLLYAGSEGTATGLALLRRAKLLRYPVVGVYHSPPGKQFPARAAALGYDLVLTLSRLTRQRLIDLGGDPARTVSVHWGPQLDHPAYRPADGELVVSTGKNGRDLDLLVDALEGQPAIIYARHGWDSPSDAVTVRRFSDLMPHPSVLADVARASVVAIPFIDTDVMLGLTELNDALALAKPIVMTRSPHIDVDIEAVGCGIWVEPGDREGWRRALAALRDDPREARAMGERGRQFAEANWNADICAREVLAAVDTLCRQA